VAKKKAKKPKTKMDKVMHEWGEGKLKSSSGKKVTSQAQAIAIGYSEEEAARKKKRKKSKKKGK